MFCVLQPIEIICHEALYAKDAQTKIVDRVNDNFFSFRLFPIWGRHSAKVFSIRLGQLRLPPFFQPSPYLFPPNPSIFGLPLFYQVLPYLSFVSLRNLLLSSSRVHTNATLFHKVCLPVLQFLLSLSPTRSLSCPFL